MAKRQSRPKRDDRSYHGRPKRDRKRLRSVRRQVQKAVSTE